MRADASPALRELLEDGAGDAADALGRDLTPAEVANGCAALLHEQEQRAAEHGRLGDAESSRLAHLARPRADVLPARDLELHDDTSRLQQQRKTNER